MPQQNKTKHAHFACSISPPACACGKAESRKLRMASSKNKNLPTEGMKNSLPLCTSAPYPWFSKRIFSFFLSLFLAKRCRILWLLASCRSFFRQKQILLPRILVREENRLSIHNFLKKSLISRRNVELFRKKKSLSGYRSEMLNYFFMK